MTQEAAHAGLVTHPLQDGGKGCQACHAHESARLVGQLVEQTGMSSQVRLAAYLPADGGGTEPEPVAWPDSNAGQAPFWLAPAGLLVYLLWAKLVLATSLPPA